MELGNTTIDSTETLTPAQAERANITKVATFLGIVILIVFFTTIVVVIVLAYRMKYFDGVKKKREFVTYSIN